MIKKLTEELIHERLKDKGGGIPNEVSFEDKLKRIQELHEAEITNDWNDRCDMYFYTEETADGYVIYIASTDTEGKLYINEDVYYYDTDWFEKLADCIRDGSYIYIDSVAQDSYSLEETITELYEEWYMGEYEEIEGILEDEGYEYPKSE